MDLATDRSSSYQLIQACAIWAGPLKGLTDVEKLTFDWLDWYNNRRLHSSLGNIPPGEYETNYYAETNGPSHDEAAKKTAA